MHGSSRHGRGLQYRPRAVHGSGTRHLGKMSTKVISKFKLAIGGYVKLDYAYNSVNLGNNGVITPITR